MKSMEEYINSVYERYEESEKNHEVYKKVRMTRKRPLNTLCGVIAGLLVVCVCLVGHNKFNKQPIVDTPFFVDKIEEQSVTYTRYIDFNSVLNVEQLKRVIDKSQIIILANDFTESLVDFEIMNRKVMIKTFGSFQIEKVLKGSDFLKEDSIKFSRYGGKILISTLQNEINYDWNSWEIFNIGHTISEEEKDNTYYELLVKDAEVLKKGKYYLVFLSKNNINNIEYEITDNVYGIMEYDPITNKVKNIDTGEFEEFDWSLLKGN